MHQVGYRETKATEPPVCHESTRLLLSKEVCCTTDEGGPLGIGLQEQVPNHWKLLRLKVVVVNVPVKGRGKNCVQVWHRETNVNEPPLRCR
jgi:hypothetical protein